MLQNDSRWGKLTLGNGDATIGSGGCLLCTLCEAARICGTWPDVIPPHANEALRKASGAFVGSELVLAAAAPVFGLESPANELVSGAPGDPSLALAVARILKAGELAILHVDFHKSGQPSHFVLCSEAMTDGILWCTDAAVGQVTLDPNKLDGIAKWPEGPRIYRAFSVRPVRAAVGAKIVNLDVHRGDGVPVTLADGSVAIDGALQDRVKRAQLLLNAAGAALLVDGQFGAKTETAVETFQASQGLVVDGAVGPLTSVRLQKPR